MKRDISPPVVAAIIVLLLGGVYFVYQRFAQPQHIPEDQAAKIREIMKTAPPMMMPGTPQQTGSATNMPQDTATSGGK